MAAADSNFNVRPEADGAQEPSDSRRIWKISDLTRKIKSVLEGAFGNVWVEGEISNLRRPASGHAYLTLKDGTSQLRTVMFRSALATVRMPLKDGLLVRGFGQLTVYEQGGDYQLILRRLEPAGEGALMLQLEALKKKLAEEGLFDDARKKPLPLLPQHVGIVTSPTGAAIRDMLNVLNRRFANLHVVVAPVRVQGDGAAEEIAAAIDLLNKRGGLDVLIVGRGGGSLEDLWSFNEEVVVRAIARSAIPVISAVGHEIDWTLSDLAADVRAPTPSAAAELVVQGKDELLRRLEDLKRRLALTARAVLQGWRHRVEQAARTPGLRDPLRLLAARQQQVDYLAARMQGALAGLPQLLKQRLDTGARRMDLSIRRRLAEDRRSVEHSAARLRLLDPRAVLARGYSITRLKDGTVLRSAAQARPGLRLTTECTDGTVDSIVESIGEGKHDGKQSNKQKNEFRKGPGAPRGNRGGDGKREARPGKDGGGLRGGADAGQILLFETE